MSLTGAMVVNVTACGNFDFWMRCLIASTLVHIVCYMSHYQLVLNLDGESLFKAMRNSRTLDNGFRIEIKEGFSIMEVSKL